MCSGTWRRGPSTRSVRPARLAISQYRLDRQLASTLRPRRCRSRPRPRPESAPPRCSPAWRPGWRRRRSAAIALTVAITRGTDVDFVDSWRPRVVALAAIVATVVLAWRTYERGAGAAERPTQRGAERAGQWMRYRRRLRERIPPEANVLVSSAPADGAGVASCDGRRRADPRAGSGGPRGAACGMERSRWAAPAESASATRSGPATGSTRMKVGDRGRRRADRRPLVAGFPPASRRRRAS